MTEFALTLFGLESAPDIFLETEHGLVMTLLLYGLLTYRGDRLRRWVPLIVIAGILLSLFTPIHRIELFWPALTALVVPPLTWQAAVAVTKSGPLRRSWGLVIWVMMLLLVAFSLQTFSNLPLSNALLLGALAVTLVWYIRELKTNRTYLSTVGLIALTVLLVEIDLAIVSPQLLVSSLLSGTAVGLIVGFGGIAIFRKLKRPRSKIWFFSGWAYVAYLVGVGLGTSAIAVALTSALVVATYGYSIGLWYHRKDIPVPSNSRIFIILASGTWLLLGWQAHTSFAMENVPGIGLSLVVILTGVLFVRKLIPIPDGKESLRTLIQKGLSVLLLLVGSILFWPAESFLTTVNVEIALAVALILILIIRETIKPLFELVGIQLSWPNK